MYYLFSIITYTCSILFIVTITIATPILYMLTVVYAYIYTIIYNKPLLDYNPVISKNLLNELEKKAINENCKKCKWRSQYHIIKVKWSNIPCYIHTILVTNINTCIRKPLLIFIHGSAASSVGFSCTWDILCDEYNILCIDLPGFGKSYAPYKLLNIGYQNVTERYIDIIHNVIQKYTKDKVLLVGHSFGGYLCSKYIEKYKNNIETLVLINSAGIFPTLGKTGAYWALYFKTCFPQIILRQLGSIGITIFYTLFKIFKQPIFLYYYIQLLSVPYAFGDITASRYISLTFKEAYWLDPTIINLLKTDCKICFVYGKHDPIMVPSQIQELVNVMDAEIPLNIVEDASHFPYTENTEEFCYSLINACKNAKSPGSKAKKLASLIHTEDLLKYKSNFDIYSTEKIINKLYSFINEKYNSIL